MYQVDGPNRIFYGFPLRYKTSSLATSMCDEYFLTEMMFDFLVYLIIVTIIRKILIRENVLFKKWMPSCLYLIGFAFFIISNIQMVIGDFNLHIIFDDCGFIVSEHSSGFCWFHFRS